MNPEPLTVNPNAAEGTQSAVGEALHQKMEAKAGNVLASETALKNWTALVTGIIRKSRGIKETEDVVLPNGETGRYIKYALDKNGNLSVGKGHGRRKIRPKPHHLIELRYAQQFFGVYLTSVFKRAQAEQAAAPEGTAIKPIDADTVKKAQNWAASKARELTAAPARAAARAERQRRKASNRVNAGLIPGNSNRARCAYAGA